MFIYILILLASTSLFIYLYTKKCTKTETANEIIYDIKHINDGKKKICNKKLIKKNLKDIEKDISKLESIISDKDIYKEFKSRYEEKIEDILKNI